MTRGHSRGEREGRTGEEGRGGELLQRRGREGDPAEEGQREGGRRPPAEEGGQRAKERGRRGEGEGSFSGTEEPQDVLSQHPLCSGWPKTQNWG
eukprot:9433437-Prorocentrum_lima.AAC.1